jgi:hypothetical protein
METEWRKNTQSSDTTDSDELTRHLEWAYNEVGYVPHNRSVTSNPRVVESIAAHRLAAVDCFAKWGVSPDRPSTIAASFVVTRQEQPLRVEPGGYRW